MSNLGSGLFLMCVGMGTVFLFLLLLIAATEGIRVMFGGAPAAPTPPAGKPGGAPKSPGDAASAAAIIGAVTHHKRKRQ